MIVRIVYLAGLFFLAAVHHRLSTELGTIELVVVCGIYLFALSKFATMLQSRFGSKKD